MAVKTIITPRGALIKGSGGKAELVWNPSFAAKRNQSFSRMQKVIDSEVLRRCSPRVPIDTRMLEKSGTLGTTIGSGEVQYIVPYAKKQYYDTAESRPYDPNRGAKWFERMKAAEKKEILEVAKKSGG